MLSVSVAFPNDNPAPDETQRLIDGTLHVVQHLSIAASELPQRFRDKENSDSLTEHYMQSAATAALELDQDVAPKAMLLGMAIACDRDQFLAKLPVLGAIVDQVDSKDQHAARLQVFGHPTIHGREDLLLHFFVSAYLTALAGPTAANAAGVAKEMRDASGESGFSFADLAADRAGIDFANRVLSEETALKTVADSFTLKDYIPEIDGLAEGLTLTEFQREFGSTSDERYTNVIADIDHRIDKLASRRKETAPAKSDEAKSNGSQNREP